MWPRVLLYLILVLLAYWPAQQGGYLWDDDDYVSENRRLRSAAGLYRIWFDPGSTPQYYPLVFTTFWLEFQVWHLDTMGYHMVNILLHALNSVLLWFVLRRLELPGAWLAAAIFALHPVHVESVAWITERKNVLSGFFYLCAFLAYLRFSPLPPHAEGRGTPSPAGPPPPQIGAWSWAWYAVSLTCFLAALLSKTVVCSLPAVLILVYWWKRGRPTRREWAALIPMFIIGALLAWNTARLEKINVGARGASFDFTPVERILIAGRALWFYAGKLVWPHPLIFNYERWTIDAGEPWQYLFPIAAVAVLLILLANVRKWSRGPLAACLIFAGTLLPALGFFNVYPMRFSFVADHFQYLASIALIALFVASAHYLGNKFWPRPAQGIAAACLLLGVLGFLTWRQCDDYVNLETLWINTLKKNPNSYLAHLNLGDLHLRSGRYIAAIGNYEKAARVSARYPDAFTQWAICLMKIGHGDEAKAAQTDELAKKLLSQGGASQAQSLSAQAKALHSEAKKRFKDAADKFRRAVELEDDDPRRYANLASAHLAMQDYEGAAALTKEALALCLTFDRYNHRRYDLKKGYAPAEYIHGVALFKLGRVAEALPYLRRAVELAPDSEEFQMMLDKAEGK